MEVQSCTSLFSKENPDDTDCSANSAHNLVWIRNANSVLDNLIHFYNAMKSGKREFSLLQVFPALQACMILRFILPLLLTKGSYNLF